MPPYIPLPQDERHQPEVHHDADASVADALPHVRQPQAYDAYSKLNLGRASGMEVAGGARHSARSSAPNAAYTGSYTDPTENVQFKEHENTIEMQAAELGLAKSTIDRLKVELQQLKTDSRRQVDSLESLKKEHDLLKEEHELKTALLDSLTDSEHSLAIDTSKQFYAKPDEVSHADVEHGLRDINSQILTIAGTCSDLDRLQEWFKRPKKRRDRPAELSPDMVTNFGQIVGEKLLIVLARLDYVEEQVAVQLSMQAIMCFFVARVCELYPYSPTRRAKSGKAIWEVYPYVHDNEIQAVAARWRSLACKYSKLPTMSDELMKEMTTCTLQYLARVLLIAGVHIDLSKLQNYCDHCVGDSVKVMWTVVFQYAEKLKERVFSTDYTVTSFFAQSDYDPSVMKTQGSSTLDENKDAPVGKVLCTTELGLRRDTNLAKPGESGKGQMKTDVIVKSVVIFDQELDAMLKS